MVVAARIYPDTYYDEDGVSQTLSITVDKVRAECNRKRLKSVKRCGKRLFLGQWILDWLECDAIATEVRCHG